MSPTSTGHSGGVSRLFLHIGTMKTGTTYLQSRLRRNRAGLSEAGFCYPARQLHAVRDRFGRRGTLGRPDVGGAWLRMVRELERDGHHTGIVSMEWLSTISQSDAADLVSELAPAQVEIIVTVRDLARVIAAQWQETIQNRSTWSWPDFAHAVTTPGLREAEPARRFWRQHDVRDIVQRWLAIVGGEHVHVVTVPPSGADPNELWARVGSVVGFEPALYPAGDDALRSNVGVDAASAELLRRVNERLDKSVSSETYLRYVKQLLGKHTLVRSIRTLRPSLTPSQYDWVSAYSEALIEWLAASDIAISGSLDDLRPTPVDGRTAASLGAVDDTDVVEAAIDALVAVLAQLDAASGDGGTEGSTTVDGSDDRPRRRHRRRYSERRPSAGS